MCETTWPQMFTKYVAPLTQGIIGWFWSRIQYKRKASYTQEEWVKQTDFLNTVDEEPGCLIHVGGKSLDVQQHVPDCNRWRLGPYRYWLLIRSNSADRASAVQIDTLLPCVDSNPTEIQKLPHLDQLYILFNLIINNWWDMWKICGLYQIITYLKWNERGGNERCFFMWKWNKPKAKSIGQLLFHL